MKGSLDERIEDGFEAADRRGVRHHDRHRRDRGRRSALRRQLPARAGLDRRPADLYRNPEPVRHYHNRQQADAKGDAVDEHLRRLHPAGVTYGGRGVRHGKGDDLLARGDPGGDRRGGAPQADKAGASPLYPGRPPLHQALLPDHAKRGGPAGEPPRGVFYRDPLLDGRTRHRRCGAERRRARGDPSLLRFHVDGCARLRGQSRQDLRDRVGAVPPVVQRLRQDRLRRHGAVRDRGSAAIPSRRRAPRAPTPSCTPRR